MTLPTDTGGVVIYKRMKDISITRLQQDLSPLGYKYSSMPTMYGMTYNFDKPNGCFLVCDGKDEDHIFTILAGCYNSNKSARSEITKYAKKIGIGYNIRISDKKDLDIDISY